MNFGTKRSHFLGFYVKEEEGEKEKIQVFFLRSLKFHRLEFVEPITKVHRLDEAYACVQKKTRSFIFQMRRFGEIKVFGLRRCS